MAKTSSAQTLLKGSRAPDFSLPAVGGSLLSLQQLANKRGTLIVFMCNHCPYVKARMKELNDLYNEFADKVTFIGVNSSDPNYPGEGIENMQTFAQEYDMSFPYLLDADGRVAKAYGATCTPDPFLFNESNQLIFHGRIVDALEPSESVSRRVMREHIRAMLDGQSIDPWFDPSLGCSIKFAS